MKIICSFILLITILAHFSFLQADGHEVLIEDEDQDIDPKTTNEQTSKSDKINMTIPQQKEDKKGGYIKKMMNSHPILKKLYNLIATGGLEYIVAIILFVYGITYFQGIYRNKMLSQKWLDEVRDFVYSNFSVIGTGQNSQNLKDSQQIVFEDSTINTFPLYTTGRENFHYCHFNLELKKRQDFLQMVFNIVKCRSIFRSPVEKDCIWIDIPIERKKYRIDELNPKNNLGLAAEILIIQKQGYYLEEIKFNMPHIDKILKIKYPQLPCATLMKQKNYPLQFLTDSQEALDCLFENHRIHDFFIPKCLEANQDQNQNNKNGHLYLKNILTIHMTDQKFYNNFEYALRARISIHDDSINKKQKQQVYDFKESNLQQYLLKNIFNLADFMSGLKLKYQSVSDTKARREKIYETMRKDSKKNK